MWKRLIKKRCRIKLYAYAFIVCHPESFGAPCHPELVEGSRGAQDKLREGSKLRSGKKKFFGVRLRMTMQSIQNDKWRFAVILSGTKDLKESKTIFFF